MKGKGGTVKLLKLNISKIFIFFCVYVLAGPLLFAEANQTTLKTQNDKESYSIGYQVGLSMKADNVEVDFSKLTQGLQDGINNKQPLLSQDEIKTLIVSLKKKSRDAQARKIQEQIVKNGQESEKFLEENKKKEGVKTTKSGLQYLVLTEGKGISPQADDFVKVHYRGTFIDGKEFDSSYAKGEPIKVQTDGVIKGWSEALPMMKVGSKWRLFVPPDLAYGRSGLGQRIPPNKVLVFDMELLAVEKTGEAAKQPKDQAGRQSAGKKMTMTGEIAKAEHGYIIRSKRNNVPSEIYTILNPNTKVLDAYVKSKKTISIDVHIVSGDNVNIEKLDGQKYRAVQSAGANTVRKLSITGAIAKTEYGYVIQSKRDTILSTIYTILNPNPQVLDKYVKSGKDIPVEIRIVSGDNVNIEKIDGKKYTSTP